MVYLDSAATAKYTSKDDVIIEEIVCAMKNYWQNPSSLYATNVKNKINECRKNIANFIGAKPDEIIFTSGASESNSTAINGWAKTAFEEVMDYEYAAMPYVMTNQTEHKSLLLSIENVHALKDSYNVDEFGRVDLDDLEYRIRLYRMDNCPVLVTVSMANNEIGTIQNIKDISKLTHKYGATIHVDATQIVGHIPIDVKELGIDMMSASGHKISPVLKGIGFLYKKSGIDIKPLINGSQNNGLRGGTENTYGIIGLSKALELCDITDEKVNEMCNTRDYFIDELVNKFGCKLNGHKTIRLPNNINVTFPQNITGESLLYTLSLSNVFISTGSACNGYSEEPSHVLNRIGLTDEEAMRTVRFTLPDDITHEEIDFAINEIERSLKIIES